MYHLSVLFVSLLYLNNISVEVIDIPGHLQGQTAFLFQDFQTLFSADTLTEPPSIEGRQQSLLDYLESLETLSKLIQRVAWIVPGHGDPADQADAKRRLDQDRRYLEALMDLQMEDFSNGVEVSARDFLYPTGETRAASPDSWQIHLQNLKTATVGSNRTNTIPTSQAGQMCNKPAFYPNGRENSNC